MAEREIFFLMGVYVMYLKAMRFFMHCIFEGVEVVKILWQKEGWGLRLSLPSWRTTTLLYSPMLTTHGPHVIIKTVRIWDYCRLIFIYSLPALQALRDWTHRFNSSSEGAKRKTNKNFKSNFKKAKTMQSLSFLFLSYTSIIVHFLTFEKFETMLRQRPG